MTEQIKLKINKLDLQRKKKKYENELDAWFKRAQILSEEYNHYIENKEKIKQDIEEKKTFLHEISSSESVNPTFASSGDHSTNYFNVVLQQRNKSQLHIEYFNGKLDNVMRKLDDLDDKQKDMKYFSFDFLKTKFDSKIGFDD